MSGFFEPPPPPEPEPPRQLPEWIGPPQGTLPGVVALELVLGRSAKAAVCITRLAAYTNGFEFDVVTMSAPGQEYELDPMLFGPYRHRLHRRGGDDPSEMLRLGVEFADGSKATNLQDRPHDFDGPPTAPLMMQRGGGGGGGEWRQSEWVWPLPPPGRLSFVCEWPAADIELMRQEIDAQLILAAAARARMIFSGWRPGGPGGFTSYASAASVVLTEERPPGPPPPPPAPPPSGS